jgi:hypothetical protein
MLLSLELIIYALNEYTWLAKTKIDKTHHRNPHKLLTVILLKQTKGKK